MRGSTKLAISMVVMIITLSACSGKPAGIQYTGLPNPAPAVNEASSTAQESDEKQSSGFASDAAPVSTLRTAATSTDLPTVTPTQVPPTLAPTLVPISAPTLTPVQAPAVVRVYAAKEAAGATEIFVEYSDGTAVNITNNPAEDAYPSLSPDGTKIAVASTRSGPAHIYLMNVMAAVSCS